MDRLRTNMFINTEWWWTNLYDSRGEIGKQAAWKDESRLICFLKNQRQK